MLSKMPIDDAQREEKIALQEKINKAVIKGTGWTDIPEAARRVADTPWFYSFLTFNPEQRDGRHAAAGVDRAGRARRAGEAGARRHLAQMARERKGAKVPIEVVKVPGVNHLLVPAKTGEVTEYAVARPGCEGVAAGHRRDRDVPGESPEGLRSGLPDPDRAFDRPGQNGVPNRVD